MTSAPNGDPRWPLFDRFPELARLPRANLRTGVTPVQALDELAAGLWIKRDDLTSPTFGGNKVRSLEFLLGGLERGQRVTTLGSRGSTHVLATGVHARQLGIDVDAASWAQHMNPVAARVAAEIPRQVASVHRSFNAVSATAWLSWRRLRGDHVIPVGGTSAIGILGHVNAALELAEQIERGEMPEPSEIIVPLGSGGTAAGLALGCAIAGMKTRIVATRVVPFIVGRAARVMRLSAMTSRLIERQIGGRLNLPTPMRVVVIGEAYGGGYGKPLARAADASNRLRAATGIALDDTYAGKAFAAAVDRSREGPTLFWLTFDSRWLGTMASAPAS